MKFSRRNWLQAAAGAALFSPIAASLSPKPAHAAAKGNVLFVYVPDGCIPEQWHPSGTETNFQLPAMSQPLEAIKSDLVFLQGLNMYAGEPTHEGGIRKVLTGVGDQSLDVFLGQQFKSETPHASVHLGVHANFQNGSGSMSFIGAGQEVKPDDDPINAFDRLFGDLVGGQDPAKELAKNRKAAVLAAAIGDLKALRGRLGQTENAKLTTHLESLEEAQQRIVSGGMTSCTNVTFNQEGFTINPMDYYPKTYHKEENFRLVGKLQTDLLIMSLACGLTRVGSLMWSHPVSPTIVPNTGVAQNNHDASHYGQAGSNLATNFITLKRWFMDRFVELIQGLKSTTGPNGAPLLDNTLVVLCSELGDSNKHDHVDVPFLLAGGKNMGLKTGRYLDYRGSNKGENETHTKLLVSVAKLVGVDVPHFGYTGHGQGPLPGLV